MIPETTSGGSTERDGTDTADPRERLRAAGLRATGPRVAVLRWLREHPHATADQTAGAVRRELGSVSTQAIYDVLHACTGAGLVRRIEPAGHPARFETRAADNHHHLVCRACGRTDDVDCVHGSAPCLQPSIDAGFAVDEAEVVFWGLCPDCRLLDQPASPHAGHDGRDQDSHHHEEGRS